MTERKQALRFPCKSCGHFHRGEMSDQVSVVYPEVKTVIDNGCMEEQCHCGKVTPLEMLT